MKKILGTFAVVAALLLTLALGSPMAASAAAPPVSSTSLTNIPVTGVTGTGDPISGLLSITGVNVANQTVSGTFQQTVAGVPTGPVSTFVASISNLVSPTGQCQILDLTLGPLNLDLLGLVVQLDTVHLNITAQRGAGNLLGNLLCAVANLLNP